MGSLWKNQVSYRGEEPSGRTFEMNTVIPATIHPLKLILTFENLISRSGVLSVTASLSECWQVLIADYGALQSIFAAITIAGLFYGVFVMLRSSISPRRTRRNSSNLDKKKKKRKGHTRHRTSKSKTPSSPVRSRSTSSDPTAYSSMDGLHSSHDEHAPDLALLTPVSSPRQLIVSDPSTLDNENVPSDDLPETTTGGLPHDVVANSSSVAMEKSLSGRTQVTSVSTMEMSIMSDDLSCSSKSLLSVPSVSVGSTKSAESSTILALPRIPSYDSRFDKGTPSMLLRHSKRGCNLTPTGTVAPITNERQSRWDALKPGSSPRSHPHQIDRQVPAKNGEKQLRQRQVGPHRSHNRKIERAAVVGSKARSGGKKTLTSRCGLPVGSSDNCFHVQSADSPAVLDDAIFDSATDTFTLPPPPPGLDLITTLTTPKHHSDATLSSQTSSLPTSTIGLHSLTGYELPSCCWQLPTSTLGRKTYVLTFPPHGEGQCLHPLTDPATSVIDSPSRLEFATRFPEPVPRGFGTGVRSLKENPFAPEPLDSEEQIEADLQALGGQMAGSILDF